MKRSLTRLFVAIVAFLAACVELAHGVVRLATALVDRTARQLGRASAANPSAPPALPAPPSDAADRLTAALTGMKFRPAAVRAFVATVRARVDKEPLETLVREGIAKLSD